MKFAAGLSTSQVCSCGMPLWDNNSFTWWPTSPKSCVSSLSCVLFLALFVVSLRDDPCCRPARVVSSAAQAAAVVPPIRRHGEMLRLINRRQHCLNIPPEPKHEVWRRSGGVVNDSPVLPRRLELDKFFGEQLKDYSPASEEEGR